MLLGIIHLSDIHFRKGNNPISERVEQIVRAATSSDMSVRLYIVVASGDIAYSGISEEYEIAQNFFGRLRECLQKLRPEAVAKFVTVPGNHDCVLPESETSVRDVLVQGIMPSIHSDKPDPALLSSLLLAQSHYEKFNRWLGEPAVDGNPALDVVLIEHEGTKIQLNLYNTALTSRHKEKASELHIPTRILSQHAIAMPGVNLRVSVFHHTYIWLHPDSALAFRGHIERTSDIALTGHQHLQHTFYKDNSTGERVLYLEGGALQDSDYPQTSAFQVVLLDSDTWQERTLHYRWSGSLYKQTEDTSWRALALKRPVEGNFIPNDTFQTVLNDIGTPLRHSAKSTLKLRDIFIYPDLMVRSMGAKPKIREILGRELLRYVAATPRIIFQGPGLIGKTSLAKILFDDLRNQGDVVPLLLTGRKIRNASEKTIVSQFWKEFQEQYDRSMLDAFQQLEPDRRALIIDDWHLSALNPEGQKFFLKTAQAHFGKILLMVGDFFEIDQLLNKATETILEFESASIQQLGHVLRGELIDRWLKLGREHTVQPRALAREIEETERLVENVIGKNTLPSTPFVILSILQAEQDDKTEVPEAGSFGYLYEVLVTTALNTSTGRKAQLEKKYVFLARLAYEMFKSGQSLMPEARVRQIGKEYAESHLVKVDLDAMLTDLEKARVLDNSEGNYSFHYAHLFHYFVARYYKDGLGREGAKALRDELTHMVNHISSDQFATIILFVLYFARDSRTLIHQLIANADQIFAGIPPAQLDADVERFNQFSTELPAGIPEKVNLEENRSRRRELADRMDKSLEAPPRGERAYPYSEKLSDAEKLDLAYRHIDLLGQVIRNFPGSLPGPEKLAILKATYLLGLRSLHVLLDLLTQSAVELATAVAEHLKSSKPEAADAVKIGELAARLLILLSRIITFGVIKKISGSVGVADLEDAYDRTLTSIGRNNATELIDVSIKLDHLARFPYTEIRRLHGQLTKNQFALNILTDLVTSYVQVFDVDTPTRQKLEALFKAKPNQPILLDPSRKR